MLYFVICLYLHLSLSMYHLLHERDSLKEDNIRNIVGNYVPASTLLFSFNRILTCVYSMYAVETLEKLTQFLWKLLKLLPVRCLQQKCYWQSKLQYYSLQKISAYVKKYNCLIQHKKRKK